MCNCFIAFLLKGLTSLCCWCSDNFFHKLVFHKHIDLFLDVLFYYIILFFYSCSMEFCLNYSSFISLAVWSYKFFQLLFFSVVFFIILGPLHFHTHYKISLLILYRVFSLVWNKIESPKIRIQTNALLLHWTLNTEEILIFRYFS